VIYKEVTLILST